MSEYVIDSKDLQMVVGKAMGVIALGDKAESKSVTLAFSKNGLDIEANNSVGAYRSSVTCKVTDGTKFKAHILPDLLLSYSKSNKSLTLIPSQQSLKVKAGKNFSADIYFIGENEPIDLETPEETADIGKVAESVTRMLGMIAGVRNRTDQQALAVAVSWGEGKIELVVGDSHHAVVVDHELKSKVSGKIIMTLPNMERIMSIGKHFSATESRFIAWSDLEYLSIANQSESTFLADAAKDIIKTSKRQTKVEVENDKFSDMLTTLISAVDETAVINFSIKADGILASVVTGASSAKYKVPVKNFKGKEVAIGVAIHHLKDCWSTMREKTSTLCVFNNMLSFESKNKTTTCSAAMMTVGVKK